jgi:hypothetical protein
MTSSSQHPGLAITVSIMTGEGRLSGASLLLSWCAALSNKLVRYHAES